MVKKIVVFALILTVSLFMFGCSKVAEEATEKAIEKGTGEDVEVDEGGKNIKVKTEEGTVEMETGKTELPEGFPSDFPIYEGAEVISSTKMTQEGSEGYQVVFSIDEEKSTVKEFYEKKLPEVGYPISARVESGEEVQFYLGEEKKGGWMFITGSEGKTELTVWLAIEK